MRMPDMMNRAALSALPGLDDRARFFPRTIIRDEYFVWRTLLPRHAPQDFGQGTRLVVRADNQREFHQCKTRWPGSHRRDYHATFFLSKFRCHNACPRLA